MRRLARHAQPEDAPGITTPGLLVVALALTVVCSTTTCSLGADPDPAALGAAAVEPPAAVPAGEPTRSGGPGTVGGDPELEALIASRYEAYWAGFDAARRAPTTDPATDYPLLNGLAAGEHLDVTYQALIDLAEAGEAIREPDTPAVGGTDPDTEHRVRVDRIDGTTAEIRACLVNDDVRYRADGGTIVRNSVSTVLSTSTMALSDGVWKLIHSRALEIDDGVAGCWLSADAEFPY